MYNRFGLYRCLIFFTNITTLVFLLAFFTLIMKPVQLLMSMYLLFSITDELVRFVTCCMATERLKTEVRFAIIPVYIDIYH